MLLLAGADGCKKGWVLAVKNLDSGETSCAVVPHIADCFGCYPNLALLALDIPIGLPEIGPRKCDLEARAVLGRPRGSSVFPAPIRPMLKAATYWDACQIGAATDGRKLSQQCWNIVSKIKEVDNYVLARADGQSRVREVHPEVSFWALAGQPMAFPKRKRPGRQERIKTLEPLFGESIGGALAASRQMGAQPDDVLDAFVALWSAERIYRGNPRRLPKAVELDSQGLRMEILA